MCMAAAMGEEVILHNIVPKHVEALTVKLQELGVDIEIEDEKIIIRKQTPYKNVDIKRLFIQVLQLIYNNLLHHYYS